MKASTKVALLAGGVLAVGVAAVALSKAVVGPKYLLQIQASEGGTTDPKPSPSGIFKNPGDVVTITALPYAGYTVGTWILDGAEIGQQESIQVTMNMDHYVVVTFWEGGQPPPSYPVAISNISSITAICRFGGITDLGILNTVTNISVHNIDQNDNWDALAEYPMQFKVVDASGQGVPNISVDLWVDQVPDNSKYHGYTALNMALHRSDNPLRLTTDANGMVTVNVGYQYGIVDNLKTICTDADLGVWVVWVVVPVRYIAWDGVVDPLGGIFASKDGGGKTGERPSMGNFALNTVRARIPETSIPAAQGLVYCGFEVKWL